MDKNQTQWLDIVTAPKDGTLILIYSRVIKEGRDYFRTSVGWWDKQFETTGTSRGGHSKYRGAWTDGTVADWGMEWTFELEATHWMPLPKPPTNPPQPAN